MKCFAQNTKQITHSSHDSYSSISALLWCVHTGRNAIFWGGTITCKVNAEMRTDANLLRRCARSG